MWQPSEMASRQYELITSIDECDNKIIGVPPLIVISDRATESAHPSSPRTPLALAYLPSSLLDSQEVVHHL